MARATAVVDVLVLLSSSIVYSIYSIAAPLGVVVT